MDPDEPPLNPFTKPQITTCSIASALGLAWIINDPVSKISEGSINVFGFLDGKIPGLDGPSLAILTGVALFIAILVMRIPKYVKVVRDRMMAVMFFAFITIFFWAIFEQAPGSLTIFARDFTNRVLEGNSAVIFKVVNSLMTIIPLIIINYAMFQLFKKTFKKYALSNIFLSISFVIIWGIADMDVIHGVH